MGTSSTFNLEYVKEYLGNMKETGKQSLIECLPTLSHC